MNFFDFFNIYGGGKYRTYDQHFALDVIKIIGLTTAGIFTANIILTTFIHYLPKKNRWVQCTSEEKDNDPLFQVKQFYSTKEIILESINIFLFWLVVLGTGLQLSVYSGFFQGNLYITSMFVFFCCLLGLIVEVFRLSIFQRLDRFMLRLKSTLLRHKILFIFQLILSICIAIFLPLILDKGCLCVFNEAYGMTIFGSEQFSTEWTRSNWLPDQVCNQKEVCHVYATLTDNTANEVIINVHTGVKIQQIFLNMSYESNITTFNCSLTPFPISIEDRGQRNIFSCLATNLLPHTQYELLIINSDSVLFNSSYITIASKGTEDDLTIFFGGDWGYQSNGLKIVQQIKKINPDAILIGGDIAYDNGNIHCYYSWDLFLEVIEAQFKDLNRIIPFIFSVGNHDVGFTDYPEFNITVSDNSGPLYFTYFPQRIGPNNTVPQVKDRIPYNIQAMQNLLIFALDSGYLYTHDGIQLEWMKQILSNDTYKNYSKIAHYHVPLYPICFGNSTAREEWFYLTKSIEAWVPIFDQYEFVAAFENHVHSYKRTFPLKNNQRADKGTVYFGDGSMGVPEESCSEEEKTYGQGKIFDQLIEATLSENTNHFWVLKSFGKNYSVFFSAFQPDSKLIENSQYNVTLQNI